MEIAIAVLLIWTTCALLGAYVAAQKNRPVVEGAILGALFGPLGCLIAAVLPTIAKAPARRRHFTPARPSPWAAPPETDPEEDAAAVYLADLPKPPPRPADDLRNLRL
jgi:hypothetical protein